MSFSDVSQMDEDDIQEANAALDLYLQAVKNSQPKAKGVNPK